eukprot:8600329-Heterocapsa_arctica.AAC.1
MRPALPCRPCLLGDGYSRSPRAAEGGHRGSLALMGLPSGIAHANCILSPPEKRFRKSGTQHLAARSDC